jgi:hypothetical protein
MNELTAFFESRKFEILKTLHNNFDTYSLCLSEIKQKSNSESQSNLIRLKYLLLIDSFYIVMDAEVRKKVKLYFKSSPYKYFK